MKRIVFSVINDITYDQRMQRICTTLARAGYDVLLIGRQLPASLPLDDFAFATQRIRCRRQKGKLFYLEYNLRLLLKLLFLRADIYSAVDLDTLLPHTIAARLRGKKLVYDAHEYFTEVPEVIARPAVKKAWLLVERFCVPRVDAAYTVGPRLAELFAAAYHKSFAVVRNMPVAKPLPSAEKEEPFILYQGALNEGRCLEQLIDAMLGINCRLRIVGEGDLSEALRQRVTEKGLAHKVEFLGYLKPVELAEITNQAFLGYNLLENKGLSYYYSLANKCFDYVQAGIPVLCSEFPEYVCLCNEYEVFIFATPEAQQITSTINQLLIDKNLYQTLTNNCLKAREEWTWENEEEKLLAVYAGIG